MIEPGSRGKILEASEALFARRGFAGVGMQAVASAVGLGKSSLFHHFPTKVDLYSEVLERVLRRLGERVSLTLDPARDPADCLEAWIEALVDFLAEDPSASRLCMRALVEEDPFADIRIDRREPEPFEELLFELIEDFRRLIVRGIEERRFRPVSIPDTIQSVIGMTVYHFASGEFGEALFGGSLFSAVAVNRRKNEVKNFMRRALISAPDVVETDGEVVG